MNRERKIIRAMKEHGLTRGREKGVSVLKWGNHVVARLEGPVIKNNERKIVFYDEFSPERFNAIIDNIPKHIEHANSLQERLSCLL